MKNKIPRMLKLTSSCIIFTAHLNVNIIFLLFLFLGNLRNEGKVLEWLIQKSKNVYTDLIHINP
jgi:hypothetical protein